jgi:hypothetical protein
VTHANNEKVAKAKTTPRAAKGDLFDMFGIFLLARAKEG